MDEKTFCDALLRLAVSKKTFGSPLLHLARGNKTFGCPLVNRYLDQKSLRHSMLPGADGENTLLEGVSFQTPRRLREAGLQTPALARNPVGRVPLRGACSGF